MLNLTPEQNKNLSKALFTMDADNLSSTKRLRAALIVIDISSKGSRVYVSAEKNVVRYASATQLKEIESKRSRKEVTVLTGY